MRAGPVQQIEIEVIAAQPRDAAPRRFERSRVRRVLGQHFAGDEKALPRDAVDRLAEQLLDGARAVHLGGIEVRHAELDAAPQRAHRFFAAGTALRHIPRTLSDRRKLDAGRAERFSLHR